MTFFVKFRRAQVGKISGMDKTALFKTLTSAQKVAENGYNGMIKGQLNVISGLTLYQKIMTKLIPLIPQKILLKQIKHLQEPKT